ncbi:MAG: peptide chain release factor 1 [Planctomycetes bacterium]|nr:peptide chain release factor 1 [Planctomycetota bacterium]
MEHRDVLLRALAAKARRHAEIQRQIENPVVSQDHRKVSQLAQELGRLTPAAHLHTKIVGLRKSIADARELAAGSDAEMAELAASEIPGLDAELEPLWPKAADLLLDEEDKLGDHSVILEIRAGEGGDEAGIFAGDIFGMYQHFCASHRLKLEVLDENAGVMGGYKEIVAEINGTGAYRLLKFEGGVHRVQRVPKTEKQGRIQTSTASVAVLPKAEEIDIKIDWEKDVREDTMRAGGPGGQKVNKTESAIRLTHLATGLMVHMQDEKSQHKNRAKARMILMSRVFDHFQSKADAERAATRRDMIGTAERSEKIRTYNFPQNRVTDHRVRLDVFDIAGVMQGELGAFHQKLTEAERSAKLNELLDRLETQDRFAG